MKLDPEELPQELREITSDVTSIPGTLFFTPEIFEQLDELCVLKGLTPTQLIVEAFNSQRARWQEFNAEVMTPLKPREPEIWPEDPHFGTRSNGPPNQGFSQKTGRSVRL